MGKAYKVRAIRCSHRASQEEIYERLKTITDPLRRSWEKIENARRVGIKVNMQMRRKRTPCGHTDPAPALHGSRGNYPEIPDSSDRTVQTEGRHLKAQSPLSRCCFSASAADSTRLAERSCAAFSLLHNEFACAGSSRQHAPWPRLLPLLIVRDRTVLWSTCWQKSLSPIFFCRGSDR